MSASHLDPPPPRARKPYPVVRVLLGLTVTVAAVTWIVQSTRLEDFQNLWKERNTGALIAAFASYGLANAFRALRFRTVRIDLGPLRLTVLTLVHVFLNRVLPARTGDLAFGYLVRRFGGGSFSSGIVSVIEVRIADLLVVAALYGVALVTHGAVLVSSEAEAARIGLVALCLTACLYLLLGPLLFWASRFLQRLVKRATRWNAWLLHVEQLAVHVRQTALPMRLALMGTTLGSWLANFLCSWLVLRGIGIRYDLWTTILAVTIGVIASSLPVSLVGSFGALEVGFAAGLMMVGMARSQATACSIFFSILTWIFAAVQAGLGFFAFLLVDSRRKDRLEIWPRRRSKDDHPE